MTGGAPDLAAVAARDGATVLLVRDADERERGIEVLMLQRHPDTAFGSIWAFPGGVVDDEDHTAGREPPHDDATCSERLGLQEGGARFWAAAVRETFEETGIALQPGELHYLSHWITPFGAPKRFDTRFFVAVAPADAVATQLEHALTEHIDSCWICPHEALDRHRAGSMDMIEPTIRNLEAVGRFASAAEVVAALAAVTDPRAVDDGGGWRVLLPGDPGHPHPLTP